MLQSAASVHTDAQKAVEEIASKINSDGLETLLFYCAPTYDLKAVTEALNKTFSCQIYGCTSAGEISQLYQNDGIVALGLPANSFSVTAAPIEDLSSYQVSQGDTIEQQFLEWNEHLPADRKNNLFLISLIDGLSIMEEVLVASISTLTRDIPLVGGSAGDNLQFSKTQVFFDNAFHDNGAVFLMVATTFDFEIFRFQHFTPSKNDLVITSAEAKTRTVFEIDGAPAAEEYANLLGLPTEDLNPQVFSSHPLMLEIGSQWYVRSIQKVNPDGSLTFFCAIDEGLPLTLAHESDLVESLADQVAKLKEKYEEVVVTLGFDCILRRLEMQQKNIQAQVESVFEGLKFFGFSTYGEQINSIHVNQTLTGVIIGRQRKC